MRLLFISILFLFNNQVQTDQVDFYEQGLAHLEQGDWERALNIWIDARQALSREGKSDYRIGAKFLEYVTEHNLENLYPVASNTYLWGLQSQSFEDVKDKLIQDLSYLKVLLPEQVYKQWVQLAINEDQRVFSSLKGFWINNNPSHGTRMNERLIEHWERIAYAKKHFTVNQNSVYKTDDRGKIYVQYGPPDKIESGNFLLNNSQIQFFAREILRQQEEAVDGFGQDRISARQSSFSETISQSKYLDNISKSITDRVLSQRISRDFEIWVYQGSTVSLPENLIFIFGDNATTGGYGLIRSPEDFIPVNAFRLQRVRGAEFDFNVGPLLQLSVYHDLRFVDDKFLDIYSELFDLLLSDQSIISESSTSYLTYKYSDELEAMRNAAPDYLSLYDKELASLPMSYKAYRFLDDNLRPYHLFVVYSEPHEAIIKDDIRFSEAFKDKDPQYFMRHALVVYDEEWNILRQLNDYPAISFEPDLASDKQLPSTSLFRIPEAAPDYQFTFYGSILNESMQNEMYPDQYERSLLTPEYLVASGKENITVTDEAGSLNSSAFEASDLILGYRSDFEIDEDLFIPFYIPRRSDLTTEVDMHFLFEVYNISRGSDGFYSFEVEYEVLPVENRSRLSRLFRRSLTTDQKITLSFESEKSISRNHISVDISDYLPGDYKLRILIHDLESGKQIQREAEFSIKN